MNAVVNQSCPEEPMVVSDRACQRCDRGDEQTHRVKSEIIDILVCATCATEARELIERCPRGSLSVEAL